MKVTKTKVNHKDERGIIKDILTHTPFDAITFIISKKGAVRGNHYHKKTFQYDYVLKGSMLCVYQEGATGKKQKKVIKEGDLAFHPPHQRHSYKAMEDTEFISITHGPRNGKDYEKDVFRLEGKEKLIA